MFLFKKSDIYTPFLSVLLFTGSFSAATAQTSHTKWYFGIQVELDFSTSPPKVYRGKNILTGYNMESSASVADTSGKLLFAITGPAIYNGKFRRQDTLLSTTPDAVQGNLIFPRPGTDNQYYVCTVDAVDFSCNAGAESGMERGANFRIVTTGSDGKISVGRETLAWKNSAECQLGIPHSNQKDYWWIIHERDSSFKVFHVSHKGIALAGSYAIGPVFSKCTYITTLKANNYCDQFAMATEDNVSLFDFNNTTGVITNEQTWTVAVPYGLEFSPNGNYLFVSQGRQGGDPQNIIQYDITSGSAATIAATVFGLGKTYGNSGKSGHLQLGPDGQIYVAQQSSQAQGYGYPHYIGVISNPDSIPANFNNQYIEVDDAIGRKQQVTMGLPTIVKSSCAVRAHKPSDIDFVSPMHRKKK